MSTYKEQDLQFLISSEKLNEQEIPNELKQIAHWVVWGGSVNADGSPDKRPVDPKTNLPASSTDPETWGTYEQAVHAMKTHRKYGVGFVFTERDDYIGLDLDDCINSDGVLDKKAQEIIDSLNSYTEITPSRRGIHVIVRGKIPAGYKNRADKMELYEKGRYFTITGNRYTATSNSIERRQEIVSALCEQFLKKPAIEVKPIAEVLRQAKLTDLELLERIRSSSQADKFNRLWSGDLSLYDGDDSRADEALCCMLAFWTRKDANQIERLFSMSALANRDKWRSRKDYRNRTIQSAISSTSEVYTQEHKKQEELELVVVEDEEYDPNKLIAFPYEVISGLAKNYTDLFTELESPSEFFYFSFLTALGTIFSDIVTLETELSTSPRLYTILIGESGYTKKSTVIKKIARFLEEFKERTSQNYSIIHGVGSEVGLSDRLDEIPGDTKKAILCFDELKHFVQKAGIKNSALLDTIGTLFENQRVTSNTKSRNINITDAYISLLAASTAATYETIFSSNFTDIGFVNRLWVVPAPPTTKRNAIPKPINQDDKDTLLAKLDNLMIRTPLHSTIRIDDDARDVYVKWYEQLPKSEFITRLDTYALRLMIILSLNDLKERVDRETVEKAITLCNWQFAVRKQYAPIDVYNTNAFYERKIMAILDDGAIVTEGRLKNRLERYNAKYGVSYYMKAIKSLLDMGTIEKVQSKKSVCYRKMVVDEE